MAKFYFLGGERILKRDAKEINTSAFKDAGGCPSVLVFPWARPSFDAIYRRRRLLKRYFKSVGANKVEFCEFPYRESTLKEQVSSADLLYFTGGQVSVLLSRLAATELPELLRNFEGVIVGRSAGAMVFGQNCLVTRRYSKKAVSDRGLGFVNFSVKAHYDPAKDEQLKRASLTQTIFALPERSALAYDDKDFTMFGQVWVFENGQKSSFTNSSVPASC
jgi:peptidase E